jgi:hypothetical protein
MSPAAAPFRASDRAPSLNACLADLRDRVRIGALDQPAPDTPIGTFAGFIKQHVEVMHSRGNEPHYIDPTVSTDAREQLYAIAAWAIAGVLELDRRVLAAHRSKP